MFRMGRYLKHLGVGGVTRVRFQFAAELKLQHSNIPVCTNTKIWKLNHLVHGYMYYKWCLKNPSTCKYECNQTQGGGRIGDRPVYRKWSVYTHINIKIQWNKVWSTAVPNNSRHDDGTLHVEAGLMMVFPSKSYFGYKKTKPFNWSSCVCANCLCKEVCLCVVSI